MKTLFDFRVYKSESPLPKLSILRELLFSLTKKVLQNTNQPPVYLQQFNIRCKLITFQRSACSSSTKGMYGVELTDFFHSFLWLSKLHLYFNTNILRGGNFAPFCHGAKITASVCLLLSLGVNLVIKPKLFGEIQYTKKCTFKKFLNSGLKTVQQKLLNVQILYTLSVPNFKEFSPSNRW